MQTALELVAADPAVDRGRICAATGYLHSLVLIRKVRVIVFQAVVGPRLLTAVALGQFFLMLLLAEISNFVEFECLHVGVARNV